MLHPVASIWAALWAAASMAVFVSEPQTDSYPKTQQVFIASACVRGGFRIRLGRTSLSHAMHARIVGVLEFETSIMVEHTSKVKSVKILYII